MATDPVISGPRRPNEAFILSSWYENTALWWAACVCACVLWYCSSNTPLWRYLTGQTADPVSAAALENRTVGSVTPGWCGADLAGGSRGLCRFDVNMGSVSLLGSQSLDSGLIWDGEMSFSPLWMCCMGAAQVVTFVFVVLQNIPVMLKLGADLASICLHFIRSLNLGQPGFQHSLKTPQLQLFGGFAALCRTCWDVFQIQKWRHLFQIVYSQTAKTHKHDFIEDTSLVWCRQ